MRFARCSGGRRGLLGELGREVRDHHGECCFVDFGGMGLGEEVFELGDCGAELGGALGCGVDWGVEDFCCWRVSRVG